MIRVLQVVTYMGRGGLETMLMNYYRNIDRTKIQFDFLCHRGFEADYDAEILSLGGKIYRLPNLNPLSKSYLKALDSFFAEHKEYKIVHSHINCMSSIPLKYAKKHGVPVTIAHSHSSDAPKDRKYFVKLFYKRFIPKYADYLFACSRLAGIFLYGKKHSEEIILMNNAIDTSQYLYNDCISKAIRKEYNLGDNFVVGHVGRFNKVKNHEFLVDIFNCFYQRHKNSKLLLVGDGPCKDNVLKKAKYYNIENAICFLGQRNDVNKVLQAMDIFVFPSLFEGFGIVALEAQASGLPCLISDKVPIECKKTDMVYQMNLSDPIDKWAEKIEELSKIKRKNTYEEIKKANFDIGNNSKWLQEFYINEYKKCK